MYDTQRKERIRRLEMRGVAMSIGVTPGETPLLTVFGADIETEEQHLEIYDAITGDFLREMYEYGDTALGFAPVPVPLTTQIEGSR